ncbi:MAG: hypothetical protein ACXQS8_02720 [Candidatus Helarchaeales archaeon]
MALLIEEIGRRFQSELTVNVFRVLTIVLFIIATILMTLNFNVGIWNPSLLGAGTTNVQIPLLTLLVGVITLFGQIFANAFILIYWGLYAAFYYNPYIYLPAPNQIIPPYGFIPIGVSPDEFFVAFYFSLFPLFLIGATLSMIYFLFNCDTKWAFYSFIFMVLPMFLAMWTPYIGRILTYITFYYTIPFVSAFASVFDLLLSAPFALVAFIYLLKLRTAIVKRKLKWIQYVFIIIISMVFFNSFLRSGNLQAIGTDLESFTQLINPIVHDINLFYGNPFPTFFFNPVFLSVLFGIIYLEVACQTSYIYEVFLPAAYRGKRLEEQMQELERLAAIKEEKKKLLEGEEETGEKVVESKSITIRKFFSSEAFDYMREMIEKRKEAEKQEELKKKKISKKQRKILDLLEEEKEEEILDMTKVQQLNTYVEERYRQDKNARATLTARASLPSKRKLLITAGQNALYRIIAMILLTYVIMNVANIFTVLFIIPPFDIIYSVEFQTVEMIVIMLLPIALAFPTIGAIIKLRRRPKVYRKPKGK